MTKGLHPDDTQNLHADEQKVDNNKSSVLQTLIGTGQNNEKDNDEVSDEGNNTWRDVDGDQQHNKTGNHSVEQDTNPSATPIHIQTNQEVAPTGTSMVSATVCDVAEQGTGPLRIVVIGTNEAAGNYVKMIAAAVTAIPLMIGGAIYYFFDSITDLFYTSEKTLDTETNDLTFDEDKALELTGSAEESTDANLVS
ncbi:MAG: hypothetical protein SFT93_03560 [Rickettsiaceae bacterium]|nr:hypothetical protein [Rickettsiaceae bacterium]